LHDVRKGGGNILYEGAQGALLDIDHGTYPYVTSSNTTVGGALAGTGVGTQDIDYVLGICKAYATRVGSGPFPTELNDEMGELLRKKGNEFGASTGRPRRCGWIDLVALKRATQINGINGLAITKLDVLDGLDTIKVCIAYEYRGKRRELAPLDADGWDECKPVYLEFPGWQESTAGIRDWNKLPPAARAYLRAVEELSGCRLALVAPVRIARTPSCWTIRSPDRDSARSRCWKSPSTSSSFSFVPQSGRPVVRSHGALFLDLPVALLLGVALVMFLLAASQADLDLDLVALPVHGGGHQSVALALDGTDQLVDLLAMQQQLARAPILGDHVRGRADQRRDRAADQEDLVLQDHGITVAKVDPPRTQRLQLPALQRHASLEALVDVVLEARPLVERDGAAALVVLVLRLGHVR